MVPVVTAVVAALLAGAVALYRERREELAEFLVAVRVVRALFGDAAKFLQAFAEGDMEPDLSWATVDAATQALAFEATWSQHRERLARHLARNEWDTLAKAVTGYFVSTSTSLAGEISRAPFDLCERDLRTAAMTLEPYCDHAGLLRNPGRRSRRALPVASAQPEESAEARNSD
jgi:hypothetical protein